ALAFVFLGGEPGGSLGGAPPHQRRGVARRREHRQAAGFAARFAAVSEALRGCGGTLTMTAAWRLCLQLRTYRCIAVNGSFGPISDRSTIRSPRRQARVSYAE